MTSNTDNKALILPDKQDVQRMAEQLKFLIVGGKGLNVQECNALAILAVSLGLNPFMGEIWMIPGSGPYVGIKGQRRNARNVLGADDNFWLNGYEADPEKYGGKPGDLCWIYELRDTDAIKKFASAYQEYSGIFKDPQLLKDVLGSAPTVFGVGIVTASEINYYRTMEDTKRKGKMTPYAVAKKRAEADALKQRFPMGVVNVSADAEFDLDLRNSESGDVIDVEAKELPEGEGIQSNEVVPPKKREQKTEARRTAEITGKNIDFDSAYNEAISKIEFDPKMKADAPSRYFGYGKMLKLDDQILHAILNECAGDHKKALVALWEQHTPPQE